MVEFTQAMWAVKSEEEERLNNDGCAVAFATSVDLETIAYWPDRWRFSGREHRLTLRHSHRDVLEDADKVE